MCDSLCAFCPPTVPPIIRESISDFPHEVTVLVNKTTQLECHADGNPAPKISWFQDSQPVSSEGPHRILSNGRILQVEIGRRLNVSRCLIVYGEINQKYIYEYIFTLEKPSFFSPTLRYWQLRCLTQDGTCAWLTMWLEVQKNLLTLMFTVSVT